MMEEKKEDSFRLPGQSKSLVRCEQMLGTPDDVTKLRSAIL